MECASNMRTINEIFPKLGSVYNDAKPKFDGTYCAYFTLS